MDGKSNENEYDLMQLTRVNRIMQLMAGADITVETWFTSSMNYEEAPILCDYSIKRCKLSAVLNK